MKQRGWLVVLTLGAACGAGCATAYSRGQQALVHERYDEAATAFQQALTEYPGRVDARIGLGIARYKLGAYDQAIDLLTPVIAEEPRSKEAQLYLALSYLKKGQDEAAATHLRAFQALKPHPWIERQVGLSLKLLGEPPLTADVRSFIAAALENELAWAREVELERAAPPPYAPWPEPFWYGPFYGRGPCFTTMSGLVCY